MAMDSERVIKTRRFEQTVLRQAVLRLWTLQVVAKLPRFLRVKFFKLGKTLN